MSSVADVTRTLERLWPDSTDVRFVERRSRRPPVSTEHECFMVVPSLRSPRLLVPMSRPAAAGAIRRVSCSLSLREVAQRGVIAAGVRVPGSSRLFDRVEVVGTDDGITDHLASLLGRTVEVSLGIGSVRANRKPVLQVFDDRGRPLAFVKVGDTPVAAGHVNGEAEALRSLGGVPWRQIAVPQLIHHGQWRGMAILVMSTLPTSPWQGGRRRDFPAGPMREIAASIPGPEGPLPSTPMWNRCLEEASGLADEECRTRLLGAMERAADRFGSDRLTTGAWHGDFTPWNMAWSGRRLSVWDWERFQTGVPVGLDAVHYAVNTHVRRLGMSAGAVRQGLRDAALPEGRTPAAMSVAYLVSIAVRYLGAAEQDGGAVIRDPAIIMLRELEEAVSISDRSAA